MKLDNTLFWHDAGGCHWCGRNTDSLTDGHDGMCPVPLLVLFEAKVARLEADVADEQMRSDVYDQNFQKAYKENKRLRKANEELASKISQGRSVDESRTWFWDDELRKWLEATALEVGGK